MDDIKRLEILAKYADLARQEIEAEDNKPKKDKKMTLTFEELDDDEKAQMKEHLDKGLANIAAQRGSSDYEETEKRYLAECKRARETGQAHLIDSIREKYRRQGFVYGQR